MKKHHRKNIISRKASRFTLVELLVSMGVLLVILGFILQFFVSSQQVWTSMSQRNRVYADARVAMDLMTTMLQNTFYSNGGIPFAIEAISDTNSLDKNSKVYFATKTMLNLPGDELKYVLFQRDTTSAKEDELQVVVFCSLDSDFNHYFPPYGLGNVTDFDTAKGLVKTRLNAAAGSSGTGTARRSSVVLRRVTSFEIVPYELDFSSTNTGLKRIPNGDYDKMPYMVVIKLTLLAPNDFTRWNKMSSGTAKDDFLKERAYTFSRAVFIGEQERMNIKE